MDKPLSVIRKHDPVERMFVRGKVDEAVVGRSRDRHRPLLASTLKADDDVLLQYFIVLECLVARLEEVHVADGCTRKNEVTKRAVVRPVAEAARDDRHDLAARCGLCHGQRNECRIQVHRLYADRA